VDELAAHLARAGRKAPGDLEVTAPDGGPLSGRGHHVVATVPGVRSARPDTVHQLKIVLRDTEVWRRIQVPSTTTLARLHDVIQRAMGWLDYHLHEFEINGVRYGIDDGEGWGEAPKDERRARLATVAPVGISFAYQYDFGDSWDHDIDVEALLPQQAGTLYPVCVAGAKACPPEDCGGTPGFEDLLAVLADPEHEEHEDMRTWAGAGYDPQRFDL
jgi:hypothetical protein